MSAYTQRAVVGVDVGTSSTKGVLVSLDGELIRSGTRAHDVDRPRVGHVEMDPSVWWREFASLTRELLAPGDRDVVAVGVSGMGPCVVVSEAESSVLRPAILYGVDMRAIAQIAALTELRELLVEGHQREQVLGALLDPSRGVHVQLVCHGGLPLFCCFRLTSTYLAPLARSMGSPLHHRQGTGSSYLSASVSRDRLVAVNLKPFLISPHQAHDHQQEDQACPTTSFRQSLRGPP